MTLEHRQSEVEKSAPSSRFLALVESQADDIDAVERTVATWVQENKLLRSKRPAEFICTTTDPGSLQLIRESSPHGKT